MINPLLLIIIVFLFSITALMVLSSVVFSPVYAQGGGQSTSRNTIINSAIDGFGDPVSNLSSTTSDSITFNYRANITGQPTVLSFLCSLDSANNFTEA